MKKSKINQLLLALLAIIIAACSPKTDETVAPKTTKDYDSQVVTKWGDLFLTIDRYAPGYRPPVAARAIAYMGLAGYEAAVSGSSTYQSVAKNFTGLNIPAVESGKEYNWSITVNAAYYTMMKKLFPQVDAIYITKMDSLGTSLYTSLQAQTDATVFDRSKKYGESVANAVFDYSKTDTNGDQAYLRNQPTDYVPPVGPGLWTPTYPDNGRALLPYWGKVRTFVATSADKLANPPLPYSSKNTSLMFSQAFEVYTTVKDQTYDSIWIGEFWSDDIFQLTFEPAARWLAIANQVIALKQANLETALLTYAKVGMAMSDGGVACWNSKYIYNIQRPITYIRTTIDPEWKTALNNPIKNTQGITPPFPSYPSGHATFGGAAAEVLSDIYSYNFVMTDHCHEYRIEFNGKPRTFDSFYQMAEENAYSRIPLGVHFRMDTDEGLRMGLNIGRKVNALKWRKDI